MNINATLFVEVVIFLTFVLLTRRYIWPPLIEVIEKRQQEIQEGIDKARENAMILEQTQHECSKMIDEAKASCKKMHEQAESLIAEQLQSAKTEAESKAEVMIEQTKRHLEIEKSQLQAALVKETNQHIVRALSKILPQVQDASHIDQLVDKALQELASDQ
ncbi:F0F1 ATP synthase subunit B [Gammaproteobacteria bacterium]|nr:F0F1 ATP synthase subunit B [Gammaproteobacteria bacterium]